MRRLILSWFGCLAASATVLTALVWRPFLTPHEVFVAPPPGVEFRGPVAVSPSGATIAAATRNGRVRLIDLKSRRERELPGTEGAELPFWSPDGRAVGFFAQGQIKVIALAGGEVRCLAPAPSPRGGAWGPDGIIVYAPSEQGPLYRVSARGGTSQPVTTLDEAAEETSHRWPQFLPDGRFLYSAVIDGGEDAQIYVGNLEGAFRKHIFDAPARVVYSPARGGSLIYSRRGKLLSIGFDPSRTQTADGPRLLAPIVGFSREYGVRLFSAGPEQVAFQGTDSDRVRSLVWFDRDGTQLGTLGEPARYSLPQISPDGRQVLVARSDSAGHSNIWLMDAATGASRQLTHQKLYASHPVWSPEGSEFVFAMLQVDKGAIWKAAVRTPDHAVRVIESDPFVFPLSWSDRESAIVFNRVAGDFEELWSTSPDGQKVSAVYRSEHDRVPEGKLSPNGHWIAFVSDEAGAYNVYVSRFSGSGAGAQHRVSIDAGFDVRWSADGKELFYVDRLKQLVSIPVPSDVELRTGAPQVLFGLSSSESNPLEYESGFGYSPTPDGQRFLLNMQTAEPSPDIMVLQSPDRQ